MVFKFIVIVVALLLALTANAKEAAPIAEDPVLEARVMKLSEELRCLVCQNQNLPIPTLNLPRT